MPSSKAPLIQTIQSVELPEHSIFNLPNGMRFIVVSGGQQEVFKLETIFHAGRFYENKKLVSATTLRMLIEGTKDYTAENISETLDFYGASLSAPSSLDFSSITMYGLNKYFEILLPLYRSIVTQPIFPASELQDYIQERKQQLQVDVSKTDILAYRNITEVIFGKEHPYGYNSTSDLYDTLQVEDLQHHFDTHFVTGNCTVILSGKINDTMIKHLEQAFFPALKTGNSLPNLFFETAKPEPHLYINKPNATQTSIRIARRLFDRSHLDYLGLYMLNIVLGDYFGSRLMTNIREDKGYTYNIYSMLDMMRKDGIFLVATETANKYTQATRKEIYTEFERLQQDLIPEKELQMARNYTLGTMLVALDGAFNASNIIKDLYMNNMNGQHFRNLMDTIQSIDSQTLRSLAQKYLNANEMTEVMVGNLDSFSRE